MKLVWWSALLGSVEGLITRGDGVLSVNSKLNLKQFLT